VLRAQLLPKPNLQQQAPVPTQLRTLHPQRPVRQLVLVKPWPLAHCRVAAALLAARVLRVPVHIQVQL
jgi:hypothetical protein